MDDGRWRGTFVSQADSGAQAQAWDESDPAVNPVEEQVSEGWELSEAGSRHLRSPVLELLSRVDPLECTLTGDISLIRIS
jgi:hypothetical protein